MDWFYLLQIGLGLTIGNIIFQLMVKGFNRADWRHVWTVSYFQFVALIVVGIVSNLK